jgi:hypothetical protein
MLGEDDVPIHAVIAPSLFRTSLPQLPRPRQAALGQWNANRGPELRRYHGVIRMQYLAKFSPLEEVGKLNFSLPYFARFQIIAD